MPATITGNQTGTVGLINAATAQNSTSGTSIDFTGIPAGVKRITVMFNGVSTNGTSLIIIQIGSGSFVTSGYLGSVTGLASNATTVLWSTGAGITNNNTAAMIYHGAVTCRNVTSNTWIFDGTFGRSDGACNFVMGGKLDLSGTLDRIRITTVNGTDTFDAGSINILYE